MDGACRAKAVFSRRIGVDLQVKGTRYVGSYVGARRGAARLSGTRSGGTLNLRVQWPDRLASMHVASLGTGRMRLVTVETNTQTGKRVTTPQIEFATMTEVRLMRTAVSSSIMNFGQVPVTNNR
jgi:hypothetical protein